MKLSNYEISRTYRREEVRELLDTGFLTRGQYESYLRYESKQDDIRNSRETREKIESGESVFPSLELGVNTLNYILDNGTSHKDALLYAMECLCKDEQWLEEVKNKRFGLVKETLKAVEDHPERKVMYNNGTWNQTGFKRSPTVNALSKQVSSAKKLSDTIEGLRKEVNSVKESSIITTAKTEDVISNLGLTNSTDKAAVIALYKNGYTTKRIVEITGISRTVVNRTLKSYRDTLEG